MGTWQGQRIKDGDRGQKIVIQDRDERWGHSKGRGCRVGGQDGDRGHGMGT